MSLKTKTIQGISWSGFSQAIRLLLQLGITIILTRLLTPNDFGLLAMVVVFTNLVMVFRDFGLTAAIVQRKGLTEEHLSSSFWINVSTGLLLALLLVILAPEISYFYGENRLNLIIMALASTFFISSFGIVQTALLTKELNFKPLAILETLTVVISGTVAVIFAFSGFGVWSLVWQQIISSFVTVIFLWKFCGWRPKMLFEWQRIKELLGFGLNLTGFSFVNYFNRNLDNLFIGKFLGSVSLGIYNLAYQILLFPLNNISSVIGRVMFPSLSSLQDDKDKTCSIYIRATRYISVITFPLMMGLFVVAFQFIRVIFGSQWERSIFLVQILTIVALIQSIGATVGWIYQSQGRTDIMFRWGIFSTIINITAFIVGLRWNVEGVTISYAIASLVLLFPNFSIPFKLINLKVGFFVKQFKSIFLATVGMGSTVFMLRFFMETVLKKNDLIILITAIIIGVFSYTSFLFLLDRNLFKEVLQLFKQLQLPSLIITKQDD